MPSLIQEIKPIINYAYSLKEPVAIFLPVEEFRNDYKFIIKESNQPGLKKILSNKHTKISLICTGTSLTTTLDGFSLLDVKIKKKCEIYSLSDLSLDNKTKISLKKIKNKKILIIDDSPEDFGLVSEILRNFDSKDNKNIEYVTRSSNFIPFNKKLEDSVRPTKVKVRNKILNMISK